MNGAREVRGKPRSVARKQGTVGEDGAQTAWLRVRELFRIPGCMRHRKQLVILLALLASLLVVLDRAMWALVSQWREDQATNIWLGFTLSPLHAPVGLASSLELPNPNGLVLVSVLLSRLPNLWVISTVLGLLQAALLVWVTWLATRDQFLFAIVIGPLLSSIVLRGISVELWSQWSLIPVNLIFFAGILIYLWRPTPWCMPLFAACLALGPSIYLAGLVNSIAYAVIMLLLLALRPVHPGWRPWIAPLVASGVILLISTWITWLPYFREVGSAALEQASQYGDLSIGQRLVASLETIVRLPLWSLAQYGGARAFPPFQVDPEILSARTFRGYELALRIVFIQGVVCYVTILIAGLAQLARRQRLSAMVARERRTTGVAVTLMAVFVLMCYVLAPLLGGIVWARDQRLDQALTVLPFLLIVWYLTPLLLDLPAPIKRATFVVTCVSSIVCTVVAFGVGLAVVRGNLLYRGRSLAADVPLTDKLRAVHFIAEDWKSRSASGLIPVDYNLGAGRWNWIGNFGAVYEKWYRAPYTIGRAYDYLFLREYGLRNVQEGTQRRSFGTGRYLITYSFQVPPNTTGRASRDYVFGRLRVTVIGDR
jgi:hypothetical protein